MSKKYVIAILYCLITALGFAQESATSNPQMADAFRENGKIYVVIAVMAMVFVSAVIYLIFIERRLKKLEDKTKSNS
jgi:hypothetical protein